MIKKTLYGALAVMTLAACSQNEDINTLQQDGINFSVSAEKATRAADSYDSNNLPASFKVWAVNSDDESSYFSGDVIELVDGAWTNTTATRYWPNEGSLDFYAAVNGDVESKAFSFTVATDVAKQKDLMYAVKTAQGKDNDVVNLNFRHALAQVCFKAKNNTSNLQIKIKGVSVGHVQGTGTYTLPSESTDGSADNATTTVTGSWGGYSGDYVQYDAAFDEVTLDQTTTEANLTCPTIDATSKKISDYENMFALIPQTVTAWTTTAAADYDGAYFLIDATLSDATGDIYSGDIAVPVSIAWEQGKRYVYTLVFSEGGNGGWIANPANPQAVLATIKYEVSVDDYVTTPADKEVTADKVYTLVYNSNGGTNADNGSTSETVSLDAAGSVTVTSTCPFTRTGYTFLGWAETADATTATYTGGESITLTTASPSKTLYAVWEKEAAQPVTTPLSASADTWVRSDNTTKDNSSSSTMEIKTYTDENDASKNRYFYGLISFEIPSEILNSDKYTITKAELRLVTERIKGGRGMAIYNCSETGTLTKYTDVETTINGLSTATAIASFEMKGENNKALGIDEISDEYKEISAWTNTIDLLSYITGLTSGNINLLIAATANNNNTGNFFTSDQGNLTNSKDETLTFSSSELVPQLVITYVEK